MARRPKTAEEKARDRRFAAARKPPRETAELRRELLAFLERAYLDEDGCPILLTDAGRPLKLGSVKWGVYAFYDYDDQPIYVGQTRESMRTRIGRHLTNLRTDAVAMSVLDPFEVKKIVVWPLPDFQEVKKTDAEWAGALAMLNAVERRVFDEVSKRRGQFVILNEKDPPKAKLRGPMPTSYEGDIVSPDVLDVRRHADARIARRAATLARLAQVISERELKTTGLRRALLVQARRIELLASDRFEATGGQESVETRDEGEGEDGAD